MRNLVLTVPGLSTPVFVTLVLTGGRQDLGHPGGESDGAGFPLRSRPARRGERIVNLYALAAGISVAIFVVVFFRNTRLEKRRWAYPLLLSTFPVFYWVFAVYGSDATALQREVVAGLLFFALSFWAYRLGSFGALIVLGVGYTGHAIYDFGHNALFVNSGAPSWWPEFCGSIDLLIGVYLLWLAASVRTAQGQAA